MRIRVCFGLPEAVEEAFDDALAVAGFAAAAFAVAAVFGDAVLAAAAFAAAGLAEAVFVAVDFLFVASVMVKVRCIIFVPKDIKRFELFRRSSVKRQQQQGFTNVMK